MVRKKQNAKTKKVIELVEKLPADLNPKKFILLSESFRHCMLEQKGKLPKSIVKKFQKALKEIS